MLTNEENELLTRVGAGTPMGELMRQYWIPVLMSTELPERDGRPVRVRLLGEDLLAFRDSQGKIGLLANNCPHRGASLFFGRNEEDGLRCVYHGWKFDVNGKCVDMPNEPAESTSLPGPLPREGRGRLDEVRQRAYPCVERNGLIWTYLGPRQDPPPLPDLEWNSDPENIPFMWRNYRECNWIQALEGDVDTSHLNYLHSSVDRKFIATLGGTGDQADAGASTLMRADGAPRLEIVETEAGVLYSAKRVRDADSDYHRIHPFLFPFHTMIRFGFQEDQDRGPYNGKAWVPMDDEHTLVLEWHYRPGGPWSEAELTELLEARNPLGFLPATTTPGGTWKTKANRSNDYFLDPELQRTKLFCGILGNPIQDAAMQEGMGPIYDRSREHLGTTDAMIIRVRHRLVEAARALRDLGTVPPGVDRPALYRTRPIGAILPRGADWVEATKDQRMAASYR